MIVIPLKLFDVYIEGQEQGIPIDRRIAVSEPPMPEAPTGVRHIIKLNKNPKAYEKEIAEQMFQAVGIEGESGEKDSDFRALAEGLQLTLDSLRAGDTI